MSSVEPQTARLRAPTIYDIARSAGVSHTTVSRAVNGGDGMTDETRRRILEIAATAGYEPNTSARVLAGRVRPQLAAVIAGADDPLRSAALVDAVAREARRCGYALTIVGVDPDDARSLAAVAERVHEPGIRGTILIDTGGAEGAGVAVALGGSPHVRVDDEALDRMPRPIPPVAEVVALAAKHLTALGHRSIVRVVSSPDRDPGGQDAHRAGRQHLLARVWEGATADAGFAFAEAGVLPADCTAVIAPTVSFALGFSSGLRARGIRIPHDLSVVALEERADAAHVTPPLTTVTVDAGELARRAVAALLDLIGGATSSPDVRACPRLVARNSTGPPRARLGVPR